MWMMGTLSLPTGREQEEIVRHIEKASAHLRKIEGAVSAAVSRLIEYRCALITNAVTGKIKVV
jgi:type I restriction enzyme, S subunit